MFTESSIRFRDYCKFSCISDSAYPRAYEGRARPRDPGNEDGTCIVVIMEDIYHENCDVLNPSFQNKHLCNSLSFECLSACNEK